MALGKDSFYIGLFAILLLAVGVLNFGNALDSSGRTLTNDSIDYIEDYNGYYGSSGLDGFTDASKTNLTEDDLILDQEDTEGASVSDFLANLNYYKNRVAKLVNYVKLVYNLPTFFLNMLGLPLDPFGAISTGLNTLIYIGLLIYFINKVRGS